MRNYIFIYFISFTALLLSNNEPGILKKQLKHTLKRDINNSELHFRFAQYLVESKKYDKAIQHYEITKNDDTEQGWYSEFMIGRCYQLNNDWSNALKYYNSSFERHPTRSEPLFYIADYYVNANQPVAAYPFLLKGNSIPYPQQDSLFINADIYKYKFKELLGIASYYINEYRPNGLKYLDQIAFDKDIKWEVKYVNLLNSLHYIENIKNATFIPIEVNPPFLQDWSLDRYKPCNPSILKTQDGYVVNCRAVNYVQWCPGHLIVDGSGMTRTRNIIVKYDKQFNKFFESCVEDNLSLTKYPNAIQGLEDLRIFTFNDEIYFTATTCQLHPKNIAKICLGKFEFDKCNMSTCVNKITMLEGPNFDRPEKNWMPFVVDGELLAIYSFNPYIVYKPCIETGKCVEFINKDLGYDFSRISGSAHPIPFDDGYLLMVHEGIWSYRRYYLHRFFYLNKNFELIKYSDPFTFKHKGIEMCCGMTIDHNNKNLVMAIALEDREAYLCSVDLPHIRSMLKDISELKI